VSPEELREIVRAEVRKEVRDGVAKVVSGILKKEVLPWVQPELESTIARVSQAQFSAAFEKSIIPSFQDSVAEMFKQIQSSFDEGMLKLASANTAGAQEIARDMKQQLVSLHGKIQQVDSKLDSLLQVQAAHTAILNRVEVDVAPAMADPMELLGEGKIAEAVEASLEMKDMDVLLALLAEMTPAQLTDNCSKILILCMTQQLAVDLSDRDPAEGLSTRLDWIKNLVVHILFNSKAAEDDSDVAAQTAEYSAIVMNSVDESIIATQQRIQTTGESDKPHNKAALTDLNMLSHFVKGFKK